MYTNLPNILTAVERSAAIGAQIVVIGLVLLALLLVWPGLVTLTALILEVVFALHVPKQLVIRREVALAAVALMVGGIMADGLTVLVASLPSAGKLLPTSAALVFIPLRGHFGLLICYRVFQSNAIDFNDNLVRTGSSSRDRLGLVDKDKRSDADLMRPRPHQERWDVAERRRNSKRSRYEGGGWTKSEMSTYCLAEGEDLRFVIWETLTLCPQYVDWCLSKIRYSLFSSSEKNKT